MIEADKPNSNKEGGSALPYVRRKFQLHEGDIWDAEIVMGGQIVEQCKVLIGNKSLPGRRVELVLESGQYYQLPRRPLQSTGQFNALRLVERVADGRWT